MIPVVGLKSMYGMGDISSRMVHSLPYIGHKIASSLGDKYQLYTRSYEMKASIKELLDSLSHMTYIRHKSRHSSDRDFNTRVQVVNEKYGYPVVVAKNYAKEFDFYNHCTDPQYFFAPNLYVDKETFDQLHQHFLNFEHTRKSQSYKLEGKLEGMDDMMNPNNFKGDALTQAVKAKAFLDLLDVEQEQNSQCQQPGQGKPGDKEDKDKEQTQRNKLIQAMRDDKNVNDEFYGDGNGGQFDEGQVQKPDAMEKALTEAFLRDHGIISDHEIDLSFNQFMERSLKKDPQGDIYYERQKDFSVKNIRKGELAHPDFVRRFISKQTLQKVKYTQEDKFERIVFMLIDVSGSMSTTGKLRVRNAIISDRFKAVQEGYCRLFIGGYLNGITKEFKEVVTVEDANYFINLSPYGGGTSVEQSIKDLLRHEYFKDAMKNAKSAKGEIIIVNDGEDTMGPFDNDGSFLVHGMQLGNGPESGYLNEGLLELTRTTGGKYLYFDTNKQELNNE